MSSENPSNRLCRTCLTQEFNHESCNSLYAVIDLDNGESLKISKIIENCVNLEVTNADRLPQIICNKCTTMIGNFYVFRDRCHKNNTFLRNQLDTLKIKCEIKIEDTVDNMSEVQIENFEEGKIIDLNASSSTENLEKPDMKNKSEINTSDCLGSRYGESSGDFSDNTDFVLLDKSILENSRAFGKYPNTRAKIKTRKRDFCETSEDISNPTKNSTTAKAKAKQFSNEETNNQGDISKQSNQFTNSNRKTEIFNKDEEFIEEQQQNISLNNAGTLTITRQSEKSSTNTIQKAKTSTVEEMDQEPQKTFHKCDICFEVFDNRKELMIHRRANHINEISEEFYTIVRKNNKIIHFICKICKKICKHKNVLRVHLRSHTGEKPYVCPVCSQCFAQKRQSQKHMKVHNLEIIENNTAISYKCALCQVDLESEFAVKAHYEEHHPPSQETEKIRLLSKPTEWQLCYICGEFRKEITDHLKWHAGKKKYECKMCGKILSTRSSLSQHRQRHAIEKKYICDTCGKSFKIQHDLTFHRRAHFEERKHECHICNRKFLQKVRLRIHLKVHAGEKPT